MHATTIGSVHNIDVVLTQACREQSYEIGWEQFLRGRISSHWGSAYRISQTNPKLYHVTWAWQLIIYLLNYANTLWKFWNGVLHGHSLAETHRKKLESLHKEITCAYDSYKSDPFIITCHQSSLFSKPFRDVLKKDIDFQQSWLRTYKEAELVQQGIRQKQAKIARTFFLPWSQ